MRKIIPHIVVCKHDICRSHRFIDGLVQERRNSNADAVELRISCANPSICYLAPLVSESLFRRRSKKTSKLRVTGHSAVNSPVTGEFPAKRASNAENTSIWWRHHDFIGRAFISSGYLYFTICKYHMTKNG